VTSKEIFNSTIVESFNSKRGIINVPTGSMSLSRKQKSFLNLAVRMAETSDVTHKHGAVIVRGGRVLSLGMNRWRNRDLLDTGGDYNPNITTHAEIDALSRISDPRGVTVYVARVGKNGDEKFSRPCDNCAKAMIAAGVKSVVYTV
jgi:deoxycytidylate deaminase